MALDLQILARRLKRAREIQAIEVMVVQQDTGIASERLNQIESGSTKPTGDEVLILANYYHCDFRDFLDHSRPARFEKARKAGYFPIQECELDDLAELARQAPGKLGSGEMSCIAMAYRIRSIAFMTDEKAARKFAENKLSLAVETTPKLYAWLHYNQLLSDGDHSDVISEHENYEKRPLTPHFNDAYQEALRCRLMSLNHK